jgi:hypothetical protein
MLVQDCYIHDIATNGLYPKGGSIGSIIERCLIRNCGGDGISMAQSSGTAFYDTVANPEYYGCRDCIARNNIIENCQGSGIDLEAALRAKVYNNTLINVANTSRGGIRFAASSFGGSPPDRPCTDCEIINNIIVLSNATARPMLFMGANSHTGTLTMSNNRYFKTGGTAVYWWEPTGQYGLNLSGWQTSSGTDTNSTEGDPQVGADWHLLAGSPCISAAMTLAGFTDDYDGNTRGGAWDIGPDQTGAAPIQTPPPTGTLGTGGGFGATLSITTSALPDGVRGDPYVATITCTGGSGPYTWSLSSGNLPLGLALDTSSTSNSTTITGTPYGEGGRTTFSVTVTGGGSITRSFTISIPGHGAGGCGGTCNCTGNECSVIGWYGVIAMIAATLAWRRKRRIARR